MTVSEKKESKTGSKGNLNESTLPLLDEGDNAKASAEGKDGIELETKGENVENSAGASDKKKKKEKKVKEPKEKKTKKGGYTLKPPSITKYSSQEFVQSDGASSAEKATTVATRTVEQVKRQLTFTTSLQSPTKESKGGLPTRLAVAAASSGKSVSVALSYHGADELSFVGHNDDQDGTTERQRRRTNDKESTDESGGRRRQREQGGRPETRQR